MKKAVYIILHILVFAVAAIPAYASTNLIWHAYTMNGDTAPTFAANNGAITARQVIWNDTINLTSTSYIQVEMITASNPSFTRNYSMVAICMQNWTTWNEDCVDNTNVTITFDGGQRSTNFTAANQTQLSDVIAYNLSKTQSYLLKFNGLSDFTAETRDSSIGKVKWWYSCTANTVDDLYTTCTGVVTTGIAAVFAIYNYTNESAGPPPVDTGGNSLVTTNFSAAYNTPYGSNFSEAIELWNWNGTTPTCNITLNSTATIKCFAIPGNITNQSVHCQNNYSVNHEIKYEGFVTCTNTTRTNSSANFTFWMDTKGPSLTSAFFLGGNNSYHYRYLNGTFTWTDSNLYRLNVTIDNTKPVNEITGINTSTYIYVMNVSVENLTAGVHQIRLRMADSHTANVLTRQYSVTASLLSKELVASSSVNTIRIMENTDGGTLFNPFSYEKLDDKITFTYKPSVINDPYVFTVTTTDDIFVVEKPDTVYKKWLVSGENWIDFYNPSEPDMKVSINKVARNSAEVSITGLKNPTLQKYESIGELNVVTTYYNFTRYNVTMVYQTPVLEGQFINSTLNITTGAGNLTGYTYSFKYNNTPRNVSVTDNGSSIYMNVSFNAPIIPETTVTVTGIWWLNTSSENTSLSFNQIVSSILIDQCGNLTNTTVANITFYDESNPTVKLATSCEVSFTYWSDPAFNVSSAYNNTDVLKNSYRYCIFPADANFSMNAYFKYVNAYGYTHRYYLFQKQVSADTTFIKAYNHNTTTGISLMRGTVRKSTSYAYYPDVLAILQRYYTGENVWRDVQHELSDEYGLIAFNVIEKTVDYRIAYYDLYNHLLNSPILVRFSCTSSVCEPTILLTPYGTATAAVSVVIDPTYNNVTKMLNVTWTDLTNLTVYTRLLVTQDNPSGVTTICDSTLYKANGNLTCNLSGYTGLVNFKVYTSQSPEMARVMQWIDLGKSLLADYIGNKEGSVWAFVFVGVFATAGLATGIVGVIIATVFSMIILYSFGMFSMITITAVILIGGIGLFIMVIRKKSSE